MKIIKTDKYIKLIADEGKRLTSVGREYFSETLFLPPSADISDYEEVGREIWKHFIIEENPDIVELQEQVKDLKDIDDITMTALAEVDNNTNTNIDIILNAINELYLMIEDLMAMKGGE